jgi:hypothetical protein
MERGLMTGVLIFKAAEVLPLALHSLDAQAWVRPSPADRDGAEASLVLVADQGVYLVSGGKPTLAGPEGKGMAKAYAEGLAPGIDPFDSWYDRKLAIVGGDDFARPLPWVKPILSLLQKDNCPEIRIAVTENSMKLLRPRNAPAGTSAAKGAW